MKLKLIKSKLWKKDDALAYFIILAVFVGMSSSNLMTLAVAQAARLSLFEYVLCALADHYYLIYGWLFFLVFVTGKEMRGHANSEIIRYGSFSRYNSVTLAAAAVRLALLIAVHILLAAIIGAFGLAPVNAFTVSEASGYYAHEPRMEISSLRWTRLGAADRGCECSPYPIDSNLELLVGYQHYFASPMAALLGAAGYLWLGSLFLYAVIFLARQIWGSKGMLTSCVIIIVSAIAGFVSPFDESPLEFFFFNNYYILHHALLLVSSIAVAANLAVMGAFLLAGASDLPRKIRRKNQARFRISGKNRSAASARRGTETERGGDSMFFSPAPRRGLVPLYLILLIAFGVFPQLSLGGNIIDFAWSLLKGYSAESINLIELLYTLAWFAFPLIQICMFWQAERERKNDAALLRTGSFRQWRTLTDRGCRRFLLRYWLWYAALLAGTMAVLYFLYGYGAESAAEYCSYFGVSEAGFFAALLAAVLLKLTELLLLYEMSLFLYGLSGNTVLSFFVPFLGYGVGILRSFRWYPFGISAAYQILRLTPDGWSGYAAAVLCMAVILAALKICNTILKSPSRFGLANIPPEGRGCRPARDIPPERRGCPHSQSEIVDIPRSTIRDWGISHAKRGMSPGEGHDPDRAGRICHWTAILYFVSVGAKRMSTGCSAARRADDKEEKTMYPVMELKNVSKRFGSKQVYHDVNLRICAGECVGFAGRNGAGKSVLFQLMAGLLAPDNGEVWVNGALLGSGGEDFPRDVGILINETGFIGYLSGFRNLKMLAQIRDTIDDETIRATMRSVGLDDNDKTPVRKYSMGMKQKLGIAQAIMENQSIVILDEPYNALDFEANREVTQILERLKGEGKTILLTSHQHQYLEKLCDQIYFICDGEIVPFTEEIRKQYFSF